MIEWKRQLPEGAAGVFTALVHVASRRVLAHEVAITLEACQAKEVIQ